MRGSPDAPERRIRIPAVVTCRCQHEATIEASAAYIATDAETARFYATAPPDARQERLQDELIDEVPDRYADYLSELLDGADEPFKP